MAPSQSFSSDSDSLFNFVVRDGNGVKGMVDSGLSKVPQQCVQPQIERIDKLNATLNNNPPIDFSKLDGPDQDQVAEQIAKAAENVGFFQVVNHGVPVELLESLKDSAQIFVGQPPEKKAIYLKGVSPSPLVNYGTSFVPEKEKALEWKDYVSMLYTNDSEALQSWPKEYKKGPSGFSSSSTAEEVTQGIDGSGLTAIVTGASSGIGTETTRVLALRGVHVIMAVRNVAAGRDVKEAIVKEIPSAKVDAMELDLTSLTSVRKFASDFNSSGRPLNILINNAGVMATPFMLSKDNIELQFATNHLGHFLLTNMLLDTMKKTARGSNREGRIVNVSSEAHIFPYSEGIRFNKINDQSGYSSVRAYGQSKLANLLHANELSRRLEEDGVNITANSLHPGVIVTNLFRHMGILNGVIGSIGKLVLKNVQQGAATTCYLALHPQVKRTSGKYFSDSNLAQTTAYGRDVALAKKLWDFSRELVKQHDASSSIISD